MRLFGSDETEADWDFRGRDEWIDEFGQLQLIPCGKLLAETLDTLFLVSAIGGALQTCSTGGSC